MLQNFFIGNIRKSYLIEIITLHKGIEYIGTQNYRFGNGHIHAFDIIESRISFYHGVDKRQASSFSSQRTITDTSKIGVFVKTVTLENGNYSPILHFSILHNSVENEFTNLRYLAQIGNLSRLQGFGHRENGPRIEPSGYVITRGMIIKRVVGNNIYIVL